MTDSPESHTDTPAYVAPAIATRVPVVAELFASSKPSP
jgi:hypothetical protein